MSAVKVIKVHWRLFNIWKTSYQRNIWDTWSIQKESLLLYENDNKEKPFLANGIPQSYHSSIIPTSIIAITNWIDHFRVSTVVYHHVELTVRFRWCLKQAAPFRFSQYNDRLFYGHTFITKSSKVQRRVRKAQKQKRFASQTSNCPTLSG